MRRDYAHEIYKFVKILTPKKFSPIFTQSLQMFRKYILLIKSCILVPESTGSDKWKWVFHSDWGKTCTKVLRTVRSTTLWKFWPPKNFLQSSPNGHTHPLRYHDACSRTWETVYLPNTYFALLFLHWPFFDVIPCTLCLCHCLVSPLNTCFNFLLFCVVGDVDDVLVVYCYTNTLLFLFLCL